MKNKLSGLWNPAKKANKSSKIVIKPVQLGSTTQTQDEVVQNEEKRREILASIYDWDQAVTLQNIPVGYNGANTVTLDVSEGSVLFTNDFFRKNINSLIAGLTRCDNSFFVAVGDKAGVLNSWSKHFSNITGTPKEDTALLQNVYYLLQDRSSGVVPVDMTVFLFVNNVQNFAGDDLEMIKEIVANGSAQKVFVVATTDIIGASKVKNSIPAFETFVLCDFKTSIVENTDKSFTPYDIPASEIELSDVSGAVVNHDYLNMKQFLVYNALSERAKSGLVVSDAVSDILTDPRDIFSKAHNLQEDEIKELLILLGNTENKELVSSFADTIDSIGELAITLSKILEGEKPGKIGHIPVEIPELKIETEVTKTPKVFSDAEIDAIFLESIEAGVWQDIAKLDDEQLEITKRIVGVTETTPKSAEITANTTGKSEEISTKKEVEEVNSSLDGIFEEVEEEIAIVKPVVEVEPEPVTAEEPKVAAKTKPVVEKKPTKLTKEQEELDSRENTIRLFMETTGYSREEAEKMLS